MTDSRTLLAKYTANGSEEAFRELVGRYINLVYSSARRLTGGDAHLAQDVTQIVFTDLARMAAGLSTGVMLGGWLHQRTFHVAMTLTRAERRRQDRERRASEMNSLENSRENVFAQIAPALDEAILQLNSDDRKAILLRFFEQQDFRTVGEALGSNEDAARMRVNRALEKLQSLLKHRGATLSAAVLGTALASEAVTAAPAGLAAGVAGTALASTAKTGVTLTILKCITMTTLQKTFIAVALAASIATPLVLQHQEQVRLRNENQSLRQQLEQLSQLQTENERLSNMIATASSPSNETSGELLKLRGEVELLQNRTNELAKKEVRLTNAQQQALAKLRASTSLGDALTAMDILRRLAPAPEILSELAAIMKENRFAARAIANGDVLHVIAGDENAKIDAAFRPLLRDSDATVRQAAAYVIGQALQAEAGSEVLAVAIEGLKSSDENILVSALSTLPNAGQDHKDLRLRVTANSLGSLAEEATAALLGVVKNSRREDLRDDALRLLDGLHPDLSQADSTMQATLKEHRDLSDFIFKLDTRQATVPEIIDGLKQFPKAAPAAADALVAFGSDAQIALPALKEALETLTPKLDVPGPDRVAAFRTREHIVNAMQRLTPDQPKLLFTESDMRSVMRILQDTGSGDDEKRRTIALNVVRPVLADAPGQGHELTPDQMHRLLDALKTADQATYAAVSAQVEKIDPRFFASPTQ